MNFGMTSHKRFIKISDSLFVSSTRWVMDNVCVKAKEGLISTYEADILTMDKLHYKSLGLPFESVINVAWNIRPEYPFYMPVLQLGVDDHDEVPRAVYDVATHFYKTFKPTLVHCNAGLNRSNAFAAACLMSEGWSFDKALNHTQEQMQWEITKELKRSLRLWKKL